MTSHRKTDYRLRRLDANRLELPNDRGIPVRIFANDGVPIERAAVDELLGLLELQETIARMLLAAPELFETAGPNCAQLGYCPENDFQNPACKVIRKAEALELLKNAAKRP